MTTECLFRDDSYLTSCPATVVDVSDQGIVLDRTVLYATSGGQPGDRGLLRTAAGIESCPAVTGARMLTPGAPDGPCSQA